MSFWATQYCHGNAVVQTCSGMPPSGISTQMPRGCILGDRETSKTTWRTHPLLRAAGLAEPGPDVVPEDMLRARCSRLMACFLSSPPATDDLEGAARLSGDETELGRAVSMFARVCAGSNAASVAAEYHDLFVGLARGELVPYGSYYLTGFLHEKPLSKLRQDMARLGVEREDGVAEPEDHIASGCEMMAGFIDGSLGRAL